MERLLHEHDAIGMHIFRQETSCIDQLSDRQRDNRERFVSFCLENGFVISNTWFEQDSSKLVTFSNVT